MTDIDQLNRLLDRSRAEAEKELPLLAAVYERALRLVAADASRTFSSLTAATWQPEPEGSLLRAVDAVAASIAVTQSRLQKRILKLVAGDPLTRLGIAWDVKSPLAADLLARAGGRTGQRLGAAATPILRDTVAKAYEQGLSVPDTAALIRANLEDAAPWQAEMLARTDLNGLANGGSVIAASLAGASYKTWLATMDDRTRDTHAEADGQTVPVAHAFTVGGEQLEFPGDPQGSDAETANCRCTVTYSDALRASAGGRAPMGALSSRGTMLESPADTGSDALTAAGVSREIPISGVAVIEGVATRDSTPMPRIMLSKSLSWDEMPVPFMAKTVTAEAHDGAEVAGRIDSFRRVRGENGTWNIAFKGALTTPYGIDDIAPMIDDQTLRGVSADLGATEWAIVDRETLVEVPEADLDIDAMATGKYFMGLKKGQILGLTLCQGQAIAGATVALAASASGHAQSTIETRITLDAPPGSLVAAAAPAAPPRDWFETPEPPGKMPLTITPEGRVFGHLAPWDGCHMGFAESSCVSPPRSRSGYAYFHVGEITTDDGETVAVGKLMLAAKGGKHAHVGLSKNDAARHYDDTSMVAAHLRAVDGRFGIWVAGALSTRLTDAQVRELRSLSPSGDWRPVGMDLEMICALAVPVPGYPIPRADVEMIRVGEELRVKSLVASAGMFDADPAAERALVSQGLLDERDTDARTRALVARAEGGIDGLLALATGGTDA